MSTILERCKGITEESNRIYQPQLFRLINAADREKFNALLHDEAQLFVHDQLTEQLKELIKTRNPAVRLTDEDYAQRISAHLAGTDTDAYGVWVYYPWARRVVHLLDEAEFTEVRTSRNKYKITTAEQELLMQKKIGIIGLSVGQSIALTLVMERVCGELRLADFDTAELSNLNRIRTGVHNLGVYKVVLAAREIAEIDPFVKVKIYEEGLQDHNMESFFSEDGMLDLLVEVCDGLDMKIASRFKAREKRIPVVMDTNDRGMLDIERFDLEPSRPLLHGLAGDLTPEMLKTLPEPLRVAHVLNLVGAATLSPRMKVSMMELNQTISTWPQLASSVVLGGAITTDVCRRILLDQLHVSGRYYVDMDEIVNDHTVVENNIAPAAENIAGEAGGLSAAYLQSLLDHAKQQNGIFKRFPFDFTVYNNSLTATIKPSETVRPQNTCILGAILAAIDHKLLADGKDLHTVATAVDTGKGIFVISFAEGKPVLPVITVDTTGPIEEILPATGINIVFAAGQSVEILASAERLLHFSPSAHKIFYNYLDFSGSGNGVAYEASGLPAPARPLYLMASDPEAVAYLGQWGLGNALKQLAMLRLSGYRQHVLVTGDPEDSTGMLEIGRKLQSLMWSGRSSDIYINDCILELFKEEDFSDIYKQELLLNQEGLITLFNKNIQNGLFICSMGKN